MYDSLQDGRSGDWILMGAISFAPIQTGPGAHPASYTMHTRSFLGVKQLGCGVDHPPPSSAKVKERVELYLYSTSRPSWPVLGWTLPIVYVIAVNSNNISICMRKQYLLQDMSNNYCHTTSFTISANTTITAISNSYKKVWLYHRIKFRIVWNNIYGWYLSSTSIGTVYI